jgi:hypothetical protein
MQMLHISNDTINCKINDYITCNKSEIHINLIFEKVNNHSRNHVSIKSEIPLIDAGNNIVKGVLQIVFNFSTFILFSVFPGLHW